MIFAAAVMWTQNERLNSPCLREKIGAGPAEGEVSVCVLSLFYSRFQFCGSSVRTR